LKMKLTALNRYFGVGKYTQKSKVFNKMVFLSNIFDDTRFFNPHFITFVKTILK